MISILNLDLVFWWDASTKWLMDFYENNKQLVTGGLAGAILTILYTKFLPSLYSIVMKIFGFIGKKLGGRFAYKNMQDAYLNWVVLQNQDLNLTGIVVGSGVKPKLEQIFISLKLLGDVAGDSLKDNEIKSEKKTWENLLDDLISIRKILYYNLTKRIQSFMQIEKPQQSRKSLSLFEPPSDRFIQISAFFI